MLAFFLAVVVGGALVGGVVRAAQRRGDAERRHAERKAYEERERAERAGHAEATVLQLAERFFPFAVAAMKAHGGHGETAKARLRETLDATPGIELGRASIGFPAVLPLSERRKHLIVLGKSGFGKTTIGLRLMRDDLREGRGVCILGSEAELFREWLLPMVPKGRAEEVIYFKPADTECSLTWNPLSLEMGEDQALAAGELFAILKRAVAEGSMGPRTDAILSSAFAILVGRPGATLWSVSRLVEDEGYRAAILADVADPYLGEFWTKTFPEYPAGAALPLANRLNQFLRLPQLRASICHPESSFSIRDALASNRILFFDVSGLDPDATRLLGQMLLSKFQIELMRRERIAEAERKSVHVYVDEFHIFAGSAEGTWRELLARGRRYGLGLHLFTQHPNQLPKGLQYEIFGNVSSAIALNLSAGDAATVRREFLAPGVNGVMKPIPAEEFVSLPVGEGFARLGSGAGALRVRFASPIEKPDLGAGDAVREISWKTYAASRRAGHEAGLGRESEVDGSEGVVRGRWFSADRGRLAGENPDIPVSGRGGEQHRLLQHLVLKWAEAAGFKAMIEQEILGGAGRVDVALSSGENRIAVEVAVSSKIQQVCASVNKYLSADFSSVLIVSTDEGMRREIEAALDEAVTTKDRGGVRVLSAEGTRLFLAAQGDGGPAGRKPLGYRVRVECEPVSTADSRARIQALADLLSVVEGGPA